MSDQSHRAPTAPSHFQDCAASLSVLVLTLCCCLDSLQQAQAVTRESPEVREVISRALGYLETKSDERLGGKCLIALAFYKSGISLEHPRIQEAIQACMGTDTQSVIQDSMYSHALAIIFLAEIDPVKYRSKIEEFSNALATRQKGHGGWGYTAFETGDTSQTQYAILSYWELMQIGLPPQVSSVERAADWLLRTQDPSGAWGYQGMDPGKENGGYSLRKQNQTTLSMLAAGLGSTLICANILGAMEPGSDDSQVVPSSKVGSSLPAALREVQEERPKAVKKLSGGTIDKKQLNLAIKRGQEWFDQNFESYTEAEYHYYLLYSIERYKSFEEFLSGKAEPEPKWYQAGFEFIRQKQADNGSLYSQAGYPCATAFAVLFLERSTQQSIKASMGEGTLVGGRGLTANLSRMKLKNGHLVAERQPTQVDKFLEMLESESNSQFENLMAESTEIDVDNITPAEIHRLEQLVKTGGAESRLVAVQGLGKLRSLDYVPTLLFGLTDPDKRVVRAARDGLKYVSRKFDGYGPPDNFTEREQYDAREAWKNWYLRVRPDAILVP